MVLIIDECSIGGLSTIRLSKKELIDIINKTFPDDRSDICVITETSTCETNSKNQTITFANFLEK